MRSHLKLLPLIAAFGCTHPSFPGYPDHFRQFAYIANSGSNTITVLDLIYLRPDRTLRVGENPVFIATNPKRPEAYVLSRGAGASGGSLTVIDTSANQVVASIPLHRSPSALSVEPSGHRAFVANSGSNNLSVIDLDARRPIAAIATPPNPTSALIAPDGRTLLVTLPDSGTIALFAVASLHQAPLTLRATFAGCPGAASPVILPDSSKAFIACPASNQILALSLAAAPTTWAARQDSSLTTDHALALLVVGANPTHLALKPDGGEVFVSNSASGSISEIDTQSNQVGNTFPIGNQPTAAIVSADNSTLWVANSGADSISLYSIDDGKLLTSLHTGAFPSALAFSVDPPADHTQRLLLVTDQRSGDVAVIRTSSKVGPALFTMLPAGDGPAALAIPAQ